MSPARETDVWALLEVRGPRGLLCHVSLPAGPQCCRPLRGNVATAKHDDPRSPVPALPYEDHPVHLDGDSHHILGHRSRLKKKKGGGGPIPSLFATVQALYIFESPNKCGVSFCR